MKMNPKESIKEMPSGQEVNIDEIQLKFLKNPTSGVTASMRRAVGMEVLKVDLRPKDEVSAHCDAEDRGRPSTSRLRMIMIRIRMMMMMVVIIMMLKARLKTWAS